MRRLPELQATILASAVSSRRFVAHGEATVQSIGQLLFDAVFSAPEIAGVYRASAAVASDHDESLRLVLRLDAPELAVLPWECLFDRSIERFVSRHEPLIRHLSVPLTPPPLKVAPPLRILAMISSPRNLAALDVQKERLSLTHALSPLVADGVLSVHWIEQATWPAVQDALMDGPWHVVHFIGHGDFDVERDEGVIFLEDEQAWAQRVSANNFVELLREAQPMPRLVVLNACESSSASRTDVFSSSAATLVRGGVSAVTAMQFEITDPAAVAFCGGFYAAIGHQRGVDEAVTSGRRRILGLGEGSLEWITPTLYLRGQTTQLFARSEIPLPDRDAALKDYRRQADAAAGRGDPETAILLLDSVLAENPDDTNAQIARSRSLTEARGAADHGVGSEPSVPPSNRDDIWTIVGREAAPRRVPEADIAILRRVLAPDEKVIRCVKLPLDSSQNASIVITDQYLHMVTRAPEHSRWTDLLTHAPPHSSYAPGHLRIAHRDISGVDTDSAIIQLHIVNHGPLRLTSADSDDTQFLSTVLQEQYGAVWSTSTVMLDRHPPLALILTAVGIVLLAAIVTTAIVLRPGTETGSMPMSRPLSGSELVVARQVNGQDWELFLADFLSATPGRRLTERKGTDSAPVLSPDRTTVVYIRIENDVRTLRVAGAADLNGDRLLFVLPAGCTVPQRPAWNPTDASMLAVGCRDGAGRTSLRLMRTDGTVVATVTQPAGFPQTDDLAFSKDGRRLGFWASSNKDATDGRLFSVAISGGAPEPIFASGGPEASHDADLAFSPDGKHIAFSRRDGTRTDLMVAGTDGSDAVPLITGSGHNQAPTWAPDGTRIAYKSDAPTSDWPGKPVPRIWVTSSTRADPHLLWTRNAPEQQSTPAWR